MVLQTDRLISYAYIIPNLTLSRLPQKQISLCAVVNVANVKLLPIPMLPVYNCPIIPPTQLERRTIVTYIAPRLDAGSAADPLADDGNAAKKD